MSSEVPVTLITGTRKGIGRHLAQHYLAKGHLVYGISRQPSDLQHENYRHFESDVADEARIVELFLKIRKETNRLDHLINNAGIASMNHSLITPMSSLREVYSTNVFGTFLLCREAAKMMTRQKRGRIVNFSTVAVPFHLEGEAAYASSKAAVVSLTQILAKELGKLNILVNAVGPTPVDTDLIRGVPADKIKKLVDQQPLARMGTVDDVTNVVDFFLSPASSFITGQVVYLGGVS